MNKCLLLISLILLFYSCRNKQNSKNKDVITSQEKINNVEQTGNKHNKKQELAKIRELERISDSIKLDDALQKAVLVAKPNIDEISYKKIYETYIDSFNTIYTEIKIGNFFTPEERHLIIHRHGLNMVFINIYLITGNVIYEVLEHEQWIMEYTSDTIKDVNGDNKKDFLVNYYGVNGCCLRAFSNVYLLSKNKKNFTESFEFINPTFSSKEKIIRGICYGHPGETEMYKYQWKDEKVDTIEYIFYQKNDKGEKTGKIVKSPEEEYYTHKNNSGIIINKIPKEYKNISGFDWFTGNL